MLKRKMNKYLMFIPAVVLLLLLSSCENKNQAKESQESVDSPPPVTAQESKTPVVPKVSGEIFDIAEEMPVFPGGSAEMMSYIQKNLKYPVEAVETALQGRVILQFIVTEDGSIADVNVVRSVDPIVDEEAVRVVKGMPKWIPGKKDGKAVNVKYTIPVVFKLN
jgi:TonB family protein